MVRIISIFVIHRISLLVIALVMLNFSGPANSPGLMPEIRPVSALWDVFVAKASNVPEVTALKSVLSVSPWVMLRTTTDPFIWLAKLFANITGLSPFLSLVILSNLFFLFFLSELMALLSRMVTTDVAAAAAVLMILWPTSYELSLGAGLAMSCYLITACLKYALDNHWLYVGFLLGALALVEPVAMGLVPLMLYLFWYFQRHFQTSQVIKKAIFFLVPVLIAIFWRWDMYRSLGSVISHSALLNLFTTAVRGSTFSWTFGNSVIGQTVTILFLAAGAVASAVGNVNFIHKLIPIVMVVLLLLFSPYGTIASRAPLAAVCLEGVAGISRPMTRLFQVTLIVLGVLEVCAVFR